MGKFVGKFNECVVREDGSLALSFVAEGNEKQSARRVTALAKTALEQGKDKLKVEVTVYRESRSLDANAYLWVLIGKLSQRLKVDKVEVYRKYIHEMGICKPIEVNDEAVGTFKTAWGMHGIGWIVDEVDKGREGFTVLHAYYGSSVYNRAQMNALINSVVEDCHELELETKTPDEIYKLVSLWGEK